MNFIFRLLIEMQKHRCWTGGLAILAALVIRHIIKRRRFYRRNAYGAQTFRSYSRSIIIPLIEGIINLVALVLLIYGTLLLVTGLMYKENRPSEEPASASFSATLPAILHLHPFMSKKCHNHTIKFNGLTNRQANKTKPALLQKKY